MPCNMRQQLVVQADVYELLRLPKPSTWASGALPLCSALPTGMLPCDVRCHISSASTHSHTMQGSECVCEWCSSPLSRRRQTQAIKQWIEIVFIKKQFFDPNGSAPPTPTSLQVCHGSRPCLLPHNLHRAPYTTAHARNRSTASALASLLSC